MGVPSFYSWLSRRYPLCVYDFPASHGHRVDFLYLDMNLIIYKCATNPNVLFKDHMRERDFEEVWTLILNYLNELISLVNPQKCIFMAFDGVAPRAKMNQQRQRRFSSAKHDQKIQEFLSSMGLEQQNMTFKNNQISPGTEFMHELNEQLRHYLKRKFLEDDRFPEVIFSGSDVPGEGEHKMLTFIRNMQTSPDFDPSWTHMIYSADADLIMLGLATHLKEIMILREEMNFDKNKSQIAALRKEEITKFQVINLAIVKEYFEFEYSEIKDKMQIQFDIDKIIDDFILVFFFVGNDFLPRIFCFDFKQGTVELLIQMFKDFLKNTDKYVTEKGVINWPQMIDLLKRFSKFEIQAMENRVNELRKQLRSDETENKEQLEQELTLLESLKLKYQNNEHATARRQFYQDKCGIDMSKDSGIKKVADMAKNYLEGVQFVLEYYYRGVPSWSWYYPHFYSPLCSDIEIYLAKEGYQFQMQKDEPFEAFMQLLLIITPHNRSLLPKEYWHLFDKESNLRSPVDYYPKEFVQDPFGAIWEHQYITKIPFVDLDLLESEFRSVDQSKLSEKDRERNKRGVTQLYQRSQELSHVKSRLAIFKDFETPCQIQHFNQDDVQLCHQFTLKIPRVNTANSFPAIKLFPISRYWLQDLKDKQRRSQQVQVEIEAKPLTLIDEIERNLKTGKAYHAYCGFPVSQYGEVVAVITAQTNVIKSGLKKDQVFDYASDSFQALKDEVYYKQESKGIHFNIKAVVMVFFYQEIFRNSDGTFYYNKSNVRRQVMPLEYISNTKIVNLLEYQIDNYANIPDEFPIDTRILLLHNGAKGKVARNDQKDQIMILIDQKPSILDTSSLREEDLFYSLKYVSTELKLSEEIILNILGRIKIYVGKNSDFAECYDLGFNAIDRAKNQLVPELVRIHLANADADGGAKYAQFRWIEISKNLFDALKEYKKQFYPLIGYLKTLGREALQYLQEIKLADLEIGDKHESLKKLLAVYVWILTLPLSQYMLCSVASHTASSKTLFELPQPQLQLINSKAATQNGWVLKKEKFFVPPFMAEHPPTHNIGDRVIGLKDFGFYGTVVGIVDDGNSIWVEILWDEPRFGLTNLGGRCPLLRGSLVKFMDVFNLTQPGWTKQLSSFVGNQKKGWNYQPTVFQPSFDKPADQK